MDSPTEYNAWFECFRRCGERYPLDEIVYRCRRCGGLLEVVHDFEKLGNRSAASWMKIFEERSHSTEWPFGSGVWGKKEWVLPNIDNGNIVSMFEGHTNLFWAERFGRELGLEDFWVKHCGNSHTGSFKDLGMTVLVSAVKQMIAQGKKIPAVACASTGDTSAALAAYCASAGIQSIVFLPKGKVSNAQLVQPLANGALVLALETDFDGCMEIVQKVCTENDLYLANSMNSLRVEGQKTVSIEVAQQFDWVVPDWVVIPGGNLGNVSALGKGFLMMRDLGLVSKLPRIAVAQAHAANPLYRSFKKGFKDLEPIQAEKTLASAIQIGNPVSFEKAVKVLKEFDGVVEEATEDELANASARADRAGMFTCPHTGVALAGLIKLIDQGVIKNYQKVVLISTANGLKFPEFKIQYHEGQLDGVTPAHANLPIVLPPDYDSVRRAIFEALDKRF
ncbi:MAG: threonine synthase [Deltaproteobacteria bacterium]|nr:threonine synthase [Deltaproteobacteria bacterium]